MIKKLLTVYLAGLIMINLVGCTSTRSTLLNVSDNDISNAITTDTESATELYDTDIKAEINQTEESVTEIEKNTAQTYHYTAENEESHTTEPINAEKLSEQFQTTEFEPQETIPLLVIATQTTTSEPRAEETTGVNPTEPIQTESSKPVTFPKEETIEESIFSDLPVTSETHKQTAEEPRETESSETTIPITEPVPKSIYDAPFDIEQIRSELIAVGENMGMRHRTSYKDGTVITPDNSSWELPITANASFSGVVLKRSLHDYVSSYDEYELYGGEPITDFTIYVKQTTDGYEFYFLH